VFTKSLLRHECVSPNYFLVNRQRDFMYLLTALHPFTCVEKIPQRKKPKGLLLTTSSSVDATQGRKLPHHHPPNRIRPDRHRLAELLEA